MSKVAVINVVGLTPRELQGMPHLAKWASLGRVASVRTAIPAVTCAVQANMLTGKLPREHGVVGNGWYSREDAEIRFWRQSNQLVQAPKIWDAARELSPGFRTANLFWWFNMYSAVDVAVTPRPMYPADGRKIPDVHTKPGALRDELQGRFGRFPLFEFWGPKSSIRSSQWIADAAMHVDQAYDPDLTLVYLPHLDYCLQQYGPGHAAVAAQLRAIDRVVAGLIAHFEHAGAEVVVLSEYGIAPAAKPVHLNRVLRRAGLLAYREELGREVLDAGASKAFAVADHQIAHVYVNDPSVSEQVRALLQRVDGVAQVLDEEGKRKEGIDHPRAGDFVLVAEAGAWFTYYYWEEDSRAPDYARTVDIHRKPGYDPVELFIDPKLRFPSLKVGATLAKKALGFRSLMDVIPLDATLVRGTHGRRSEKAEESPVFLTQSDALGRSTAWIEDTDVFGILLRMLRQRSEINAAA